MTTKIILNIMGKKEKVPFFQLKLKKDNWWLYQQTFPLGRFKQIQYNGFS